MRVCPRSLMALLLISCVSVEGSGEIFARESPVAKPYPANEKGHCALTFQYLEGPGVSLPERSEARGKLLTISAKERVTWLEQVKGKTGVWMMKEPVEKFHPLGGERKGDVFGSEEGGRAGALEQRLLCNYWVTVKSQGQMIDLDLVVNVWMGEPMIDLHAAAHLALADGETLIMHSQHPKKNHNRVLLVTAKKRPSPPPRVVRLDLLHLEGNPATTQRPNWPHWDARYQFGVSKKEVEAWFRKSGTTLEAQASKRTFKDLKNTESWTIVDNKYDAPTETYSEMVGVLAEFFLLKKITMVDFTEEDRITKHAVHVQLVPDPANENAPYPFVLKSEFFHQRGARSSRGSSSVNTPKPGHYLVVDTTKPGAQNWTMLLIRAVEDN